MAYTAEEKDNRKSTKVGFCLYGCKAKGILTKYLKTVLLLRIDILIRAYRPQRR